MNLKTKSTLFSLAKIVFFMAICFIVSFALIFPLWAFANNAPRVYSAAVLVLIAVLLLWKTALWAKKSGVKKTVRIILRVLIVTAGIAACFYFLLTFRRVFALLALIAAALLFKAAGLLREGQ